MARTAAIFVLLSGLLVGEVRSGNSFINFTCLNSNLVVQYSSEMSEKLAKSVFIVKVGNNLTIDRFSNFKIINFSAVK